MGRRSVLYVIAAMSLVLGVILPALPATATHGGDTLVSVGAPTSPFSANKQNEPAIAMDANHPNVLAAGANDNIDLEACNAGTDNTCPFTPGVGTSGIMFSFDSGHTWTRPTYTGLTARPCTGAVGANDPACAPAVGPIGTLPWYSENGLASSGDPALAFGPVPDESGDFEWDNGSRLYYANLADNLGATKGVEAIAVSRTDDAETAAEGGTAGKNAWMPPVIVSRQSNTTFSDKEQIWADNAASSDHFGNVYVCWASFRSNSQGNAAPQPLKAAVSSDGGDTWTEKQVTSASNNPFNQKQGFGRSGCTIRTDSEGVVYVFAYQFAVGLPGVGKEIVVKSFDGGISWTRPVTLFDVTDGCWEFDPVQGRCVMDGLAGARDDLGPAPSVDIANGAPTGADATDQIVMTYIDAKDGLNNEHVVVRTSTNGTSWSNAINVETPGDRGFYSAPAISPDGTDLYLVYNAFTTPFRNDTTSARNLVGVVKHAEVAANGVLSGWTTLHRGADGDPRSSSANSLIGEFLGDYVYAAASRTYGAAVWNDSRNGVVCPAINAFRQALQDGEQATAPAPQQDCPAGFGNSDIYGGSWADPS